MKRVLSTVVAGRTLMGVAGCAHVERVQQPAASPETTTTVVTSGSTTVVVTTAVVTTATAP